MNSIIKKLKKIMVVIVFLLAPFICAHEAFAEAWIGTDDSSSSSGSSGGSSSTCKPDEYGYTISCAGTSWIYYEYTGNNSKDVEFPGTGVDAIIPKTCAKKGSGFWHYGVNIRGYHYDENSGYVVSGNDYGHWKTIKSGYTSVDPYNVFSDSTLNQTVGGIYTAKKYGTKATVLSEYKRVYEEFYGAGSASGINSLPDNLWGFCASGADGNFYAQSNASNRDSIVAENGGYETTNIVNSPTTKYTQERNIVIGKNASSSGEVFVTFSHNVFSKGVEATNVKYKITRTVDGRSGIFSDADGKFTVRYYSDRSNSGLKLSSGVGDAYTPFESNLVIPSTEHSGYFAASGRGYVDNKTDSHSYVMRDYYGLIFSAPGKYEFCESVIFDGNSDYTTKVCAVFTVQKESDPPEGQCPNRSGNTTQVDSFVQNPRASSEYQSYREESYAKPGDSVNWLHCYYAGVQKDYNKYASPGDAPHPSGWMNGTRQDLALSWNKYISSIISWGNSFSVINYSGNTLFRSEDYGKGIVAQKSWKNSSSVSFSDVGLTDDGDTRVLETNRSSSPSAVTIDPASSHSWKCLPYECKKWFDVVDEETGEVIKRELRVVDCSEAYDQKALIGTCWHDNYKTYSSSGAVSSTAKVWVPYNFENSVEINLSGERVYAGEKASLSNTVKVGTKRNSVTNGTYATYVRGAQIKIVAYVSESKDNSAEYTTGGFSNLCGLISNKISGYCEEIYNESGKTLNPSGNTEGSNDDIGSGSYNVFDYTAGKYYCVVSAVYPYTTTSDKQLNTGGTGWRVSKPSCKIIAKKPSFELWGGSLYSTARVNTTLARKTNGDGIGAYTSTGGVQRTFGSWTEIGVTGLGEVNGLASGNAINRGGATNSTYCNNLVPLTLANIEGGCSNDTSGNLGSGTLSFDKESLVSYFSGGDIIYDESKDCTIGEGDGCGLNSSENIEGTKVIKVGGDKSVSIKTDITYREDKYSELEDIPKLVIYAYNINISCKVERIDAILIAENAVDTCPRREPKDSNDVNDEVRSTPLRINGMIITDTLNLNRTYGAAKGQNSGVPAEVINYDTSAILWANAKADVSSSNTLNVTYQHELAPRY